MRFYGGPLDGTPMPNRHEQGDFVVFEGGPADAVVYEVDADGDAIFYGHRVDGEIVRVS